VEGLVTGMAGGALFGGAFDGRRVFLTGHTGFKGSWLSYWLIAMGAQVTGYALEPPTDPNLFEALSLADRMDHVLGDVRDLPQLRDAMSAARPEVVLHLAAQPIVRRSYDEPVDTFAVNVLGTANLLEAVRATPSVRAVVNVTSDKCYENRETDHAYREMDPLGGYDPYSASKACSELVTAAYRRSFFGDASSAAIMTARAGNVIGGGDWAPDRLVPDCVRALSAGRSIIIRNPGALRPWQHVLEPTAGYLSLASRALADSDGIEGAWNFGPLPGGDLTVGQVADAVVSEWGSGQWAPEPLGADAPHEARLLKLDVTKAVEDLGWRPVWCAADAVRRATSWYRDFYAGEGDAATLVSAELDTYISDAVDAGVAWACAAAGPGGGASR
jgi:CDP-glucose 4,6-dehydratase